MVGLNSNSWWEGNDERKCRVLRHTKEVGNGLMDPKYDNDKGWSYLII